VRDTVSCVLYFSSVNLTPCPFRNIWHTRRNSAGLDPASRNRGVVPPMPHGFLDRGRSAVSDQDLLYGPLYERPGGCRAVLYEFWSVLDGPFNVLRVAQSEKESDRLGSVPRSVEDWR